MIKNLHIKKIQMKTKLLFLVSTLLSFSYYAQVVFSTSSQAVPSNIAIQENTIQQIFSHLEKDKIPTGLLADAAVDFANLKKFNGILTDSSYTSSKVILELYSTLITSRLNTQTTFQKTTVDFDSDWGKTESKDIIPIAGLYYKYAKISEPVANEIKATGTSSAININGSYLEDKYTNGVWQNPYDIDISFAMSPRIQRFDKLNFNIVFPQELFQSNMLSEIQTIEFRISDNQPFQVINFNQAYPVNYSSLGSYRWTFKLTLNTGKVLYSHCNFELTGNLDLYREANNYAAKPPTLYKYTKYPIDPYTIPAMFPWQKDIRTAKATLYIKLAPGHEKITKPLIVAEGFDVGSIISPSEECGTNNIDDFILSLSYNGNSTLSSYLINNYDIIYVDWGNGSDYIQNNAEYFKKAIDYVNSNKVQGEQNIVIGQSMGGLVARWALKDMEDKRQNHDTKLFISHDSPHLGANIPIGLQYMLVNLRQTYIKAPALVGAAELLVPAFLEQGLSVGRVLYLNSAPAARQMLINYVDDNYQIDNSIHNDWQNQLKLKGYPQKTINVAISNGNECGVDQNLQDVLVVQKETDDAHLFSDVLGSILGGMLGRFDMATIAKLPGSSNYSYNIAVRPMSDFNANKQIYFADIKYKKKILWLINSQVTLLNTSMLQPSGILPIDKYSGSIYQYSAELPGFNIEGVSLNRFGFVPTASSLDYKSGSIQLNESDYRKAFSPIDDASNVPFSNWVVEPNSSIFHRHISFSDRNAQFIINQLSGTNQDQKITSVNTCANYYKINGPSSFCSSATFSISNLPAGYTVQWSSQPYGALSINSPNSASTSVSFSSATSAKLIATINGNGLQYNSNIDVTKSSSGRPSAMEIDVPSGTCVTPYTTRTYSAVPSEGTLDNVQKVEWQVIDYNTNQNLYFTTMNINGVENGAISFSIPDHGQDYVIGIVQRSIDKCGNYGSWGPGNYLMARSSCTGGGGYYYLTLSPNPTASELKVTIPEEAKAEALLKNTVDRLNGLTTKTLYSSSSSKKTLQVYDIKGTKMLEKKYDGDDYELNVSALPMGIYVVKVHDGNKSYEQKFIKK